MFSYKKWLCFSVIFIFVMVYIPADENEKIASWIKSNSSAILSIEPETGLGDMEKAFDQIVGNAKVVALGESGHAIHDIAIFRVRLLEYLVKNKNFKAVSLESGFFEGQLANSYVHGLENDINKVLSEAFTHNMGEWEETRALLDWMRNYNLSQEPEKRVHFCAMDMPLFQDTMMNRTKEIDTPLEQVLGFVEKVDERYYATSGIRLARIATLASKTIDDVADYFKQVTGVRFIDPDFLDELCSISYNNLSESEKNEFAALLSDLINTLDRKSVV